MGGSEEMTHSIFLVVRVKEWAEVEEIKEMLLQKDADGYLFMFSLKAVPVGDFYPDICQVNSLPPFITFPESSKEKTNGAYEVMFESGSHCSFDDLAESLPLWTFWVLLLKELDMRCIEFTYGIYHSGDDQRFSIKQAFAEIKKGAGCLNGFVC